MTATITAGRFEAERDDQNTNVIIQPSRYEDLRIELHKNTNHMAFYLSPEDEAVLFKFLIQRRTEQQSEIRRLSQELRDLRQELGR